ncbi:unnamed protein product, partial [Ixodes pacificus]
SRLWLWRRQPRLRCRPLRLWTRSCRLRFELRLWTRDLRRLRYPSPQEEVNWFQKGNVLHFHIQQLPQFGTCILPTICLLKVNTVLKKHIDCVS